MSSDERLAQELLAARSLIAELRKALADCGKLLTEAMEGSDRQATENARLIGQIQELQAGRQKE